jgi:hypothetical protein
MVNKMGKQIPKSTPHICSFDTHANSEVINMERTTLPVGFGMALAQNAPAMRAFASMSEAEQQAVLEQTK